MLELRSHPLPTISLVTALATHRHGRHVHSHAHAGPHRHLRLGLHVSTEVAAHEHAHGHDHPHDHALHQHGHSHGLVDRSIVRSREGVRAVALSLVILGLVAVAQLAIFVFSNSVALLADLVHNFGDALTAVPLGIAFVAAELPARKARGPRRRGGDLLLCVCRALRDDPAFSAPRGSDASLGARGGWRHRLRRKRACCSGTAASRAQTLEPRAHRGRQRCANGRLRVTRRRRECGPGGHRAASCRPCSRPVHHSCDLQDTWDSWRLVSTTDPGEMVER